jgi:MFS family permease
MDFWRDWTKDYMGLFLILIINVILYTVNYIVSVMGTYLLTTSFQLSGKYGRFLIVILGIGFSLSILHILPNTEITETYNSWFTYFCLRVIQGVGVVSMMVLVWGLIQGLVLYIIDDDGDS